MLTVTLALTPQANSIGEEGENKGLIKLDNNRKGYKVSPFSYHANGFANFESN